MKRLGITLFPSLNISIAVANNVAISCDSCEHKHPFYCLVEMGCYDQHPFHFL